MEGDAEMIEFDDAFPQMKDYDRWWDRNKQLDYHQIAEKLCDEILIYESDNDYQGSTFSLIRSGTKFGYLEFGWGSCGCDAAEAADSYEEWKDLFESLRDGVKWFDSLQQFLSWATNERDWKGEWSWHDGAKAFIRAVNKKYGTEIAYS